MTRLKLRNKLLQHNNKKLFIGREKHNAWTCIDTKNLDELLTSAEFLSWDCRIFVECLKSPIIHKIKEPKQSLKQNVYEKKSTFDAILQNLRHNNNFLN